MRPYLLSFNDLFKTLYRLEIEGGGCLNGLALCAGYGGIELGIERVFSQYRTVCYVEGEAFAASHLIKKMEEGRLHNAPVWNDLRTFEGSIWSGKVDIISGGFPCQPFSNAGKQLGDKDPRHLWPDIKRIISEVRPRFLFFENVPGVVKWILDSILLDLAELGYNASWCVVAASKVGAPHQRKRWFLFAEIADSNGKRRDKKQPSTSKGKPYLEGGGNDSNANHSRECSSERTIRQKNGNDFRRICENVSHTNSKRGGEIPFERKFSRFEMFGGYGEKGSIDKWGGGFENHWEVEPSMGRLVDGSSDWVDKLRLLGNGVVPQQAAYALQILGERLACGVVANRTPID